MCCGFSVCVALGWGHPQNPSSGTGDPGKAGCAGVMGSSSPSFPLSFPAQPVPPQLHAPAGEGTSRAQKEQASNRPFLQGFPSILVALPYPPRAALPGTISSPASSPFPPIHWASSPCSSPCFLSLLFSLQPSFLAAFTSPLLVRAGMPWLPCLHLYVGGKSQEPLEVC